MLITNIFIARHGETEYNRTNRIQGRGINESLNDTGRQQARAIGRKLAEENIHRVYSSSLNRSKETAQIIADRFKLAVESYPELDEMNFGIIEGRAINEIENHLAELHQNWKSGNTTFALERGESPEDVLARVSDRMDHLIAEEKGQNILFVLHGRLIRIVLSHWLGFGLREMHRIEHQNGALYHLQLEGKKMRPVFLNEVSHLLEETAIENTNESIS